MIRGDGPRRALGGDVRDGLVPPEVAPGSPRNLAAEPPVDDHVLDRRAGGHRLVGGLLHRRHLAAAVEAVGGDQHLRLAVLKPRGDGPGAVAREARRVDSADPHDRERRDRCLRGHRQEDADAVALADAEALERVRQARDLARQLCVRQRARLAVVALPDDRRLSAAPGVDVAVDAVVGEVQQPALEPAWPGDPTAHVEDARVGPEPAQAQEHAPAQHLLEALGVRCLADEVHAGVRAYGQAVHPLDLRR